MYVAINLQSKEETLQHQHYNTRVLEIENACFTTLVFAVNDGMARECKRFNQIFAEFIAIKRDIPYQKYQVIRTKISFILIKSMLLCIRESMPSKTAMEDIQLAEISSKM